MTPEEYVTTLRQIAAREYAYVRIEANPYLREFFRGQARALDIAADYVSKVGFPPPAPQKIQENPFHRRVLGDPASIARHGPMQSGCPACEPDQYAMSHAKHRKDRP